MFKEAPLLACILFLTTAFLLCVTLRKTWRNFAVNSFDSGSSKFAEEP